MDLQEQNSRSNKSRVSSEVYSEQAVERIKRLVENFFISGEQKQYAILVDGEMVVPRTADPDLFDDYKGFVHDLTKQVTVRLFYGNSPNCNTYKFQVVAQKEALSGALLAEQKVQEAIEKYKQEQEINRLKERNEALEKKVSKLKGKLEENSSILSVKNTEKLKDLAGYAFGVYNNYKNPGAPTNLSGITDEEAEISFEQSVDEENLQMLEALEEEFGAEYTRGIMVLVARLSKHADLVAQVGEVLYERESRKSKKSKKDE
ncbi:MAG: hypothetical protein Crog4KO_25990 [Crocinitomicaceae bacterium]